MLAIVHFCDIIWVARPVAIIGNVSCVGDFPWNFREDIRGAWLVIERRYLHALSLAQELVQNKSFKLLLRA